MPPKTIQTPSFFAVPTMKNLFPKAGKFGLCQLPNSIFAPPFAMEVDGMVQFFLFPKKQCFQALAPKATASPTSKNQLPYSGGKKCGTFAP